MHNNTRYDDNTLIIGVDNDRVNMCLFLYSDIKNETAAIILDYEKHGLKFSKNLYTIDNRNEYLNLNFMEDLISHCRESPVYLENIPSTCKLEKDLHDHLEKEVNKLELNFKIHLSNDSAIDCFIGDKKIQCKSSTTKTIDNMYQFNLRHRYNGIVIPYDEHVDVDFFIFGGVTNDIWMVYIVPKIILIKFGYLSVEETQGKLVIWFPTDKYQKNHWLNQFLNRYDLLSQIKIEKFAFKSDIIDRFNKICLKNKIFFERDVSNLNTSRGFVGLTKKIIFFRKSKTFIFKFSCNKGRKCYIVDEPPDFIVLENNDDGVFYIIPYNKK